MNFDHHQVSTAPKPSQNKLLSLSVAPLAKMQRFWANRYARAVVFPFLLSRTIIFSILVLAPLTFLPPRSGAVRSIALSRGVDMRAAVSESLLAGDAIMYLDIAQHGYTHPASRGWFPLFPLVWRTAAFVTGEYPVTGCLLSNGFFLLALLLLYKTVISFGYAEATASRCILYLTIFPTSHFFSLPLTESLFLLLTVTAFYAALNDRWWIAGTLGALASATRLAGILLLPALALLFYFRCWNQRPGKHRLLSLLLIPCGLLAFCSYLRFTTGDFFAYQNSQGVHPVFFGAPLVRYALNPGVFHQWSFFPLQVGMAMVGFLCCWKLAVTRQWVLAVYLLGSLLLPLSAGLLGSMTRFLMVSFPLVIVWAGGGESSLVDQTIRTVSVSFLVLLTLACALKFGLGMA